MMMSLLLVSKKSYVFKYMPPHDHDINDSMILTRTDTSETQNTNRGGTKQTW
mgnify:CR=1 FL=1